ncbi:hypothetical protein A9G48_04400 [Gilliamella sp. wkB18]|uniref:hypothetical protein n=1 Tax=Gilliamella sp. wkB18 TaxID=3120260 RepID=UPI00080E0C7C|nr:hypothetical protein [Gilliamella apicola]OCG64047.1 hypothetical protein A9G48_04400 [Gilliamella apicola]
MQKQLVNHCPQGRYHMLEKIAYDYVRAINTEGANKSKIKLELSEKVKKYSEEDKTKLRELIRKWLTK